MRFQFLVSILIFLPFVGATLFVKQQNDGYVYHKEKKRYVLEWSKRKLKWSDFVFKPDTTTKYKAETYTFKMDNEIDGGDPKENYTFILRTCFVPDKSWTKDTTDTEKLLNHEQRHFDIAEVATRKFKMELSNYLIKYDKEFNTFYSNRLKKSRKYLDSLNIKYDSETDHGISFDEQKKWDKKIDDLLRKYEGYANDTVVVKRVKKP